MLYGLCILSRSLQGYEVIKAVQTDLWAQIDQDMDIPIWGCLLEEGSKCVEIGCVLSQQVGALDSNHLPGRTVCLMCWTR